MPLHPKFFACLVLLCAFLFPGLVAAEGLHSLIILDGKEIPVGWSDGDSFMVQPPARKQKFRISSYNTLESYGPVHRWGEWTGEELATIADEATEHVRSQTWTCNRVRDESGAAKTDGYGRTIVSCPDVTYSLISAGLAHLFLFGDENLHGRARELQAKAQEARKGMWAKGVPKQIVTSLHSSDEKKKAGWTAYDRVVNTATGMTEVIQHGRRYSECEEICHGGACMLYVTYANRYGARQPACLKRNTNVEDKK